jgi:SPP1 family predicted phage head-tail adaptor
MAKQIDTIGAMRERVIIQNVTEAQSTSGFPAETWADTATVWAEVTYSILPSDEDAIADKKTAIQVALFRIRTRTDTTEKSRLSYRSELFDIKAIEFTPGREFMILQAEKKK